MQKKIEDLSSEENIYIRFIYREGDRDQLKVDHKNAFESHSEFDIPGSFIRSDYGNIEILGDYVSGVTNMTWPDNYQYKADNTSVDLWYSPLINYVVGPSYLYESEDEISESLTDEALETLIEIVSTGYHATDDRPFAVYAETPKHRFYQGEAAQPPFTAVSLSHDEYSCLSWLTVFTPAMVETYGRDALLSAPTYRTEELDDGAILIVCHNKPLDPDTNCRDVADSIGLSLLQDLA